MTTRTSIKKSQSAALKKRLKQTRRKRRREDIIHVVMDDKDLLARNSERIPKNTKKVDFWCLNIWNQWAAKRKSFFLSVHEMEGMWVYVRGILL